MIPRNEMEVVVLFSQQAESAGFEIVSVQATFPDAIIKHGGVEYRVEFEYKSSNFWFHRHNPTECDLIICWINDDQYPILPVIELSNPNWPQTPIAPPPYQERLVGFWKARALAAEGKLKEAEVKIAEFTDEPVLKKMQIIWSFLELVDTIRKKRSNRKIQLWHRLNQEASRQEEIDPIFIEFIDELAKDE